MLATSYAPTSAAIDTLNLLTSLAWLGRLSTRHLHQLHAPYRTQQCMRDLLNALYTEDLIDRCHWYRPVCRSGMPPQRTGYWWTLAKQGLASLRHEPTFPRPYQAPRSVRRLAHDSILANVLVRMIELARRTTLSGVYVAREARIAQEQTHPVVDAVVELYTGGEAFPDTVVPWGPSGIKFPGERMRRYAIEVDRGSESLRVIEAKARAYASTATPEWVARNGPFPIPVWIVPGERRRDAIMEAWAQAWPAGKWLITTDEGLQQDRWLEHYNGTMRERRLFG